VNVRMCEACYEALPRVRWREEFSSVLCDTCYAEWSSVNEIAASVEAAVRAHAAAAAPSEVLNE